MNQKLHSPGIREAAAVLRHVPINQIIQAHQMAWLGKMFKLGERMLKAYDPSQRS